MSALYSIGIDWSLGSTGVAVATPGEITRTATIGTASVDPKNLALAHARCVTLIRNVIREAFRGIPDDARIVLVVEEPAIMSTTGLAAIRHGLWMLGYHFLRQEVKRGNREGDIVTVQIQHLKQYATGKGNSGKTAMIAAGIYAFPEGHRIRNDNEADASWLAAMGMRELGHPIELAPQRCFPAYLTKQSWPAWVDQVRHSTGTP